MSALGTLFVITAPSGAGKTTLVNALLKKVPNLVVSTSYTTREKRSRETVGHNYHFVDRDEFERMIEEGEFLEYANVFGNYYGTSRKWVEQELAQGVDVILELDWQGAQQIKEQFPRCVLIFIVPPTIDALRQRLNKRNQDHPEVIERRLGEARIEISHYAEFDYLVINKHFQMALIHLRSILTSERLRVKNQKANERNLLEALLS